MAYTLYMHIHKENGKRYIGITSQPVKNRWKKGSTYKKMPRFWEALEEYGWDAFYHIVVMDGLDKKQAEDFEQKYIAMYKSNDPKYGYNIENGGVTGKLSESQRKHMRIVMLGRKQSEETKRKRSEAMKKRDYSFMIGRKLPEATRKRMGEVRRGKRNPRARMIDQYTLDGLFVARYETMNDAAAAVGLNRTSHISRCCTGERNKCAGYVWKYAEVNDG